ncbi:hypothetical protein FHQ29_10980 [Testudinibacter sp. TR-2022]|nr:hypothetical protein FHQ29_10980 [Testudinibacter sp. TR-2022]
MTVETALVSLMRGGTVVAEVLPVVKAGSVAVKSVDNMISPLAKGVDANEKLPVVGKTEGYENQTTTISIGAENNATAVPLKIQLSNESLKASGVNLDKAEVIARVDINGQVYIDTNQKGRAANLADKNTPTLIADKIAEKPPRKDGVPYPNANMATAHAEIGAIQQAYKQGVTKDKNIVIHVQGKDVCTYCRQDIASAAEKSEARSVTIHAIDNDTKLPKVYTWERGQSSIREVTNEK